MKKIISMYKRMTFEERTLFNTKFSCYFNGILGLGKIVLSLFEGVFFLVAGILNIFILLSKLECYMGVKNPNQRSFEKRNTLISIFLIFAGIQYSIYMARLIISDIEIMEYGMFLGIMIATVSFIELGIAIKGLFNAFGKGHYYRNIKIINMCSALTAIVLTEVALTSFASETDMRFINGIFGVSVGIFIIILGLFIKLASKISIVDKEQNVYMLIEGKDNLFTNNEIEIKLTNSKVCGNFTYVGKFDGQVIDGKIIKGKSEILKWNIYWKILIIILSEILIFVYGIWALIFYFKSPLVIKKLDEIMKKHNFIKIESIKQ